jgi:hypothetical protein
MSGPGRNPQFRRVWTELEKPPPKAKRPAPVTVRNQPPQSFAQTNKAKNSQSTAAATRRKRRQPRPPVVVLRAARRLLNPRGTRP